MRSYLCHRDIMGRTTSTTGRTRCSLNPRASCEGFDPRGFDRTPGEAGTTTARELRPRSTFGPFRSWSGSDESPPSPSFAFAPPRGASVPPPPLLSRSPPARRLDACGREAASAVVDDGILYEVAMAWHRYGVGTNKE